MMRTSRDESLGCSVVDSCELGACHGVEEQGEGVCLTYDLVVFEIISQPYEGRGSTDQGVSVNIEPLS